MQSSTYIFLPSNLQGMSRDKMRVSGGRCFPLIVGGLVVVSFVMICNWWSMSSANLELLRQIEDLNEQLKISMEERDQCITIRTNLDHCMSMRGYLEQQFGKAEKDIALQRVQLEKHVEINKRNKELEESLMMCNSELESKKRIDDQWQGTLDALKVDKETLTTQLEAKRKENKKIAMELNETKNELDKLKLTINSPPKKPGIILNAQKPTEERRNETSVNKASYQEEQPTLHGKDSSKINEDDNTAIEVGDPLQTNSRQSQLNKPLSDT